MHNFRSQLRYRSRYRGCRENDQIIGGFAAKYLDKFSQDQLEQFAAILELEDADLLLWMLGQKPVPEEHRSEVMLLLLEYASSLEKKGT